MDRELINKNPRNFSEFWPYYLDAHRKPWTRRVHIIGTWLAIAIVGYAVLNSNVTLILLALVCGYGFAWASHLWIEMNRPATFRFPVWSLMADLKMAIIALRYGIALKEPLRSR